MAEPSVPRDLDVDFSQVPRHWLHGNATATAIANGVNMLFPHGERFFVRSVKHFLEQIDDPVLRAQIKGFFGQEGRHAHAHDQFNAILRDPGLRDRSVPRRLQAAVVAGSRRARRPSSGSRSPPPRSTSPRSWRRARSARTCSTPRPPRCGRCSRGTPPRRSSTRPSRSTCSSGSIHRTRCGSAGLIYATITLGGFWVWGAVTLMRQDKLTLRAAWREMRTLAPARSDRPARVPARDPAVPAPRLPPAR